MEQVVSTMTGLNASSRTIVDITSVIDGIAFLTNLLALNAAVEPRALVGNVQNVSQLVADIAVAGREQSHGIWQVNQTIAQMDHVTQSLQDTGR